jgi:hypothetical protein
MDAGRAQNCLTPNTKVRGLPSSPGLLHSDLAGRLWSFQGGSSCLGSIPNGSEGRFYKVRTERFSFAAHRV